MSIRSLTIDAPEDSSNLLLLNYAGLATPLRTDSISIGRQGALLNYSSSMSANSGWIAGSATFADGAEGRFDSLEVSSLPGSHLMISNSVLSIDYLTLKGALDQYGGSNLAGTLSLWD